MVPVINSRLLVVAAALSCFPPRPRAVSITLAAAPVATAAGVAGVTAITVSMVIVIEAAVVLVIVAVVVMVGEVSRGAVIKCAMVVVAPGCG